MVMVPIIWWIRIQGFDDPENFFNIAEKKIIFFWSQISIYLSLDETSLKDVQATGEAFSPQKRTSRTSKHVIS